MREQTMSNETVFVKILDKEYQVACPREERQALIESAQLLDDRMRAIRGSGAVIGLERIAVITALNLSHELLQAKAPRSPSTADSTDLQRLSDKIERVLAGH
jgi:cell division protein ZapA